jgi:prepilin-type N-terminal cleavage/methylation domain-containing protein
MLKHLKKVIRRISIGNQQLSILLSHSAFTLIEIVIAISLASVIILGTATIFKQASSAFSQSDARNEVYQNVRATFDIIKRDISGAALNTNFELFKGESDSLTFLSSTSNNNGQPIAFIKYFLNGNTLIKSENTDADFLNVSISDMNVATATGVLGYNVNALQFNYFEKDAVVKWKNTWDSTVKKYLPDAIEVKMITSDIRNRHTETSTNIISIP